ncbi:hypothetical protein ACFSKM_02125 [Ancylobacter dichloromethanicus]
MSTVRWKRRGFFFKFVITIALAVGATGLALTMSRPGARRGRWLKAGSEQEQFEIVR